VIKTIQMLGPATFVAPATLTTNSKINLIYGLNGTGKSTVCRFLKNQNSGEFERCKISSDAPHSAYVYNQEFIKENFFESDNLKGIFSLSKENKDAEQRITNAQQKREIYTKQLSDLNTARTNKEAELQRVKGIAEETTWKIKTDYAGGDRVLEYCLDGLKGKKEALFNHLTLQALEEPTWTIESLKSEAITLKSSDSAPEK
jgi:wobble nucleotide-excising tRNase